MRAISDKGRKTQVSFGGVMTVAALSYAIAIRLERLV